MALQSGTNVIIKIFYEASLVAQAVKHSTYSVETWVRSLEKGVVFLPTPTPQNKGLNGAFKKNFFFCS